MTTRLADVIVPEVFFPYMLEETKVKSAIFESGILREDSNMTTFLSGGGRTANVPFWKDLEDTDGNIASDDPSDDATADKITSGNDIAARQYRTNGWSSMQLSGELAGDDPMEAIGSRISRWWVRHYQKMLISTLRGVYADNVANDAGDMVNDIGTDASGTAVAAELISADAILDTRQTMGDAMSDLRTLIMHSVVFTRLSKQNLIDYIPNSDGKVMFPTYLGYNVIVDDGVGTIVGTNRTKYFTYLMGSDAICYSEVPVSNPIGLDNDESVGGGSGQEEIWTRRQLVLHPYGVKWTDTSVAGEFPTNAELQTAGNWDRVYAERKQIPICFLLTNG